MKLLILVGILALGSSVPQRFRQGRQGSLQPRQGRQGTSYLPPNDEPLPASSNVAPSDTYGAASADYTDSIAYDDAPLSGYGAAPEAIAPAEGYGAAIEEDSQALSDSYDTAASAEAPVDNYGAASEDNEEVAPAEYYDDYDPNDVPADQAAPPTYNEPQSDAGAEAEGDTGIKMLMNAVPGIPGEDYPIYAEVPESGFSCDGQVDGGYYADSEAECQVFHICTADGQGGLSKYSFLCPNGTIFNQNYFICDWWFNFDCAEAEAIAEEKNSELAAARAEASETVADASNSVPSYADADVLSADAGYGAPEAAEALSPEVGYGAPEGDDAFSPEVGYGAPDASDDLGTYGQAGYSL